MLTGTGSTAQLYKYGKVLEMLYTSRNTLQFWKYCNDLDILHSSENAHR